MSKTYDDPERYNGWTNRETWAVALHINNDPGWQESVLESVRSASDGFSQDPPIWAVYDNEAEEDRDRATAVGDAIREDVERVLIGAEAWDAEWFVKTVLPVVQDIGSLWRVDWTELGAAFLSDLEEQS